MSKHIFQSRIIFILPLILGVFLESFVDKAHAANGEPPQVIWSDSRPNAGIPQSPEEARRMVENPNPLNDAVQNIAQALSYFHSSDRDIPASVLYKTAYRDIPNAVRAQIGALNSQDIIDAIKAIQSEPKKYGLTPQMQFHFNKGNIENLIKIARMDTLCRGGCFFAEDDRMDNIAGLSRSQIDELVKDFPDADQTGKNPGEFDYLRYEVKHNLNKYISEIDWYQARVIAGFWHFGMHEQFESTYQIFSRGTKNRAYIVAGGIDEIYDLLEHIRFTEREIQFWKSDPEMQMMPEAFWDYLRNWKFTGSIRAVQPGTVVFGNTPIMEVTANPIDQHIIETLVLPILNDGTKVRTKAARIKDTTDKPFYEGGSRRGANDNGFTAQNGVYGGAAGTSNIHGARLFKQRPVGFIPHSWMGYFKKEIDAMIAFTRLFPKASILPDTFEIMQGVRNGVIANPKIPGFRPDSYLPGKDYAETSKVVRALLDSMGFKKTKISGSDRLNEYTIADLEKLGAMFDSYLVGTDLASPSDASGANVVDKNAGYFDRYTGEIVNITKVSNSKPGIPGKAQTYRVVGDDGLYAKDIVAAENEPDVNIPKGSIALLIQGMLNGKRVHRDIEPVSVQVERTRSQVLQLPKAVRDIKAQPGVYPVELSPTMKARIEQIKAEHVTKTKKNIGFVFLSADPVTDSHRNMVLHAKAMLDLDEVIVVVTGNAPVHKPQPMFSGEARAKALEKFFEGIPGIRVDRTEVEGKSRYTYDTLEILKRNYPAESHEFFMIIGQDAFQTIPTLPWKDAQKLIDSNNWIVADREDLTDGKLPPPLSIMKDYKPIMGSDRHFRRGEDGNFVYYVNLHTGNDQSRTVRTQIKEKMDTIFHQVDTQLTFWMGMHGNEAGPLAVPNSDKIVENVKTMAWISKYSERVKAVSSGDAHHEVEVRNPDRWNNEFNIFKRHGMKGLQGPVGDARIKEVATQFAEHRQLRVPNFKVVGDIPEAEELVDEDFDLEANRVGIMDPNTEIVLDKNGRRYEIDQKTGERIMINAYDWGTNKYGEAIVRMIGPKEVYVYGVATDWCVVDAAMRYAKMGYKVYLVEDAVAHIFEKETAEIPPSKYGNLEMAMKKMKDAGVIFVKTADVLKKFIASIPEKALKDEEILSSENCPLAIREMAAQKK